MRRPSAIDKYQATELELNLLRLGDGSAASPTLHLMTVKAANLRDRFDLNQ
jgi:hypothetical protein